jgi:hypothetical protein
MVDYICTGATKNVKVDALVSWIFNAQRLDYGV